jgi:oligopeptide transport system substrate-binding protein
VGFPLAITLGLSVALGAPLSVRFIDEPRVLDWQAAVTGIDAGPIVNLMEGLFRVGEKSKLEPAIATGWEVSNDRRELTLKLRPDARWSDGVAVEARHFVDAWKRLLTPAMKAPYAWALFAIENAREYQAGRVLDFAQVGVKAVTPGVLKIRLEAPSSSWLYNLTWWPTFPIRQDQIDLSPGGWTAPGTLVSTGPFTLASHEKGRAMVLARNARYHSPRGNVDRLVLRFIPKDVDALREYQERRLDVLPKLSSATGWDLLPGLQRFPAIRTIKLDFNQLKAPMDSPALRRALAHAVDWSRLPAVLSRGYRRAGSLVPPGMVGFDEAAKPKFDPKLARSELAVAGYNADRILVLEIAALASDDYEMIVRFVKEELERNVPVTLKVTFRPLGDLNSGAFFEDPRRYHGYLYGLSAKNPDPDYFVASYLSDSPNNHTSWKSPAYDAAVRAARAAFSLADREKALREAQRILIVSERVTWPLYYDEFWVLVRPGVTGFARNHFGFFQFNGVSVKDSPR